MQHAKFQRHGSTSPRIPRPKVPKAHCLRPWSATLPIIVKRTHYWHLSRSQYELWYCYGRALLYKPSLFSTLYLASKMRLPQFSTDKRKSSTSINLFGICIQKSTPEAFTLTYKDGLVCSYLRPVPWTLKFRVIIVTKNDLLEAVV